VAWIWLLVVGLFDPTQEESGRFVLSQAGSEVATERFTRTSTSLDGELRIVTGQRVTYNARLEAGVVAQITLKVYAPDDTVKAAQTAVFTFGADTVTLETTRNGAAVVEKRAAPRGTIPYVNPSAALMQEIIRKAKASGATTTSVSVAILAAPQQVLTVPVTFSSPTDVTMSFGQADVHLIIDDAGRVLSGEVAGQGLTIERKAN
jgi:hypothetical protein